MSTQGSRLMTLVPMMYRDSANWKAHGAWLFEGAITGEQKSALSASLEADGTFVPEQIGGDHLADLDGWRESEDDHPWHELLLESIEVLDVPNNKNATGPCATVAAFVDLMRSASSSGWQATGWGSR